MQQSREFQSGVIRPVEVYKEAWEMIKGDYWLMFAITLVGLIIGSLVPIILAGPMVCGIYIVLFAVHEGRRPEFDQLFKGFEHFVPSLIVSVVTTLPVFILLIVMYLPMIAIAIAGGQGARPGDIMPMIIGILILELIIAVIMVCFHTLLMFAMPLIVDKKLGGIKAMTTSARAVLKNLGGVAGLFGVSFLLMLVGMLIFCVGMYLVLPLMFAANMIAYRKVFPAGSGGMAPPPPNYYQGL